MKYIIALGGNIPINPDGKYNDLIGNWNPLGQLVKVSDEDYDLSHENWVVFRGAIVSRSKHKNSKGVRYLLQLHRLIGMRIWKGEEPFSHLLCVNFINGDKYDMRRENLKIVKRGWVEKNTLFEEAQKKMKEINK